MAPGFLRPFFVDSVHEALDLSHGWVVRSQAMYHDCAGSGVVHLVGLPMSSPDLL